ncbi:MAG TPA: hypothetical protein VHV77_08670, partial [Pirellulales bacterium]|nr:hypothetical protein [Pirellulales bacterium]
KDVAYNVIEAAKDVKVPMLIIDAGKEELMDTKENGGRVAEILRSNGTPVKYHILEGIGHYGVYGEKLQEALDLELAWFNQYLKATK